MRYVLSNSFTMFTELKMCPLTMYRFLLGFYFFLSKRTN
jgi:hypothetical protein